MIGVAMAINCEIGSGQAATVNQARVIQFIAEDHIAPARQGRQRTEIREIPRACRIALGHRLHRACFIKRPPVFTSRASLS